MNFIRNSRHRKIEFWYRRRRLTIDKRFWLFENDKARTSSLESSASRDVCLILSPTAGSSRRNEWIWPGTLTCVSLPVPPSTVKRRITVIHTRSLSMTRSFDVPSDPQKSNRQVDGLSYASVVHELAKWTNINFPRGCISSSNFTKSPEKRLNLTTMTLMSKNSETKRRSKERPEPSMEAKKTARLVPRGNVYHTDSLRSRRIPL